MDRTHHGLLDLCGEASWTTPSRWHSLSPPLVMSLLVASVAEVTCVSACWPGCSVPPNLHALATPAEGRPCLPRRATEPRRVLARTRPGRPALQV